MNVQSTQDGQTNKKIRCLNENSPEGYLYLQMETQKKTNVCLRFGSKGQGKRKGSWYKVPYRDLCVVWYFDCMVTVKFVLNQRVELATSWPKLTIEVLEDWGSSKAGLREDLGPFGGRNGRGRKSLVANPFLLWSLRSLPQYLTPDFFIDKE